MTDYLRNPDEIYAASFGVIRAEANLSHLPKDAEGVAVRLIHACGMVDAADDLVVTPNFVQAARDALARKAPILVDAEMVRHGIIPRKLNGNQIICTLNDPRAREKGLAQHTTRSAAAVSLWRDQLDGAIVAIGNAPTALFALLEGIASGWPRPAVIAGFPVGFVGAVESKELLIAQRHNVPYATLRGRRGGSAMAAAVVNALAETAA